MIDLNNKLMTMESLSTGKATLESEQMPSLNEEKQDEENSLDPGGFVLLFAHMASEISIQEDMVKKLTESVVESQNIEPEVSNLKGSELINEESMLKEHSISAIEDNVAVAWINSDYYKPEIDLNWEIGFEGSEHLEDEVNTALQQSDLAAESKQNEQMIELFEASFALVSRQQDFAEEHRVIDNTTTQGININQRSSLQPIVTEINDLPHYEMLQFIEHDLVTPELSTDNAQAITDLTSSQDSMSPQSSFDLETKPLLNEEEPELSNNTDFQQIALEIANKDDRLFPGMDELVSTTDKNQLNVLALTSDSLPPEVLTPTVHAPIDFENRDLKASIQTQTVQIPADINEPEWSTQFSEQIVWLGQQGIKSAVIKLNPDDLGPLEINIRVIKDSASINITSHNQHVRDIIGQSLPKLQEMMMEQGLNLSEVHIGSETDSHQSTQQHHDSQEDGANTIDDEVAVTPLTKKKVEQGRIDYFA